MKKKQITLLLISFSINALCQVGINTQQPTQILHIDGKGNNSSSGTNLNTDDVVVTQNGALGVKMATVPTSAALSVNGVGTGTNTNQGFLPSRMSTAQRDAISLPATGLFIYNLDTKALEVNNGTPQFPNWSAIGLQGPEGTFVVSKYSYTLAGDANRGEVALGSIKVRHNGADPIYNYSDWDPWPSNAKYGKILIASNTGKPLKVSIGGYQSFITNFRMMPDQFPQNYNFDGVNFRRFFYTGNLASNTFLELSGPDENVNMLQLNPYRGDVITYHVTTIDGENYRITAAELMNPGMKRATSLAPPGSPISHNGEPRWTDRGGIKYFIVVEKLR